MRGTLGTDVKNISYHKENPKLTLYLDTRLPNVDCGVFEVKPVSPREIFTYS